MAEFVIWPLTCAPMLRSCLLHRLPGPWPGIGSIADLSLGPELMGVGALA
jgi:hypothetical protein